MIVTKTTFNAPAIKELIYSLTKEDRPETDPLRLLSGVTGLDEKAFHKHMPVAMILKVPVPAIRHLLDTTLECSVVAYNEMHVGLFMSGTLADWLAQARIWSDSTDEMQKIASLVLNELVKHGFRLKIQTKRNLLRLE